MVKKLIFYLTLIFGLSLYLTILAKDEPNIKFPIKELANCKDAKNCHNFCSLPENSNICLDFAQSHNLMNQDEIQQARKFLKLSDNGGPGGCKTQEQCKSYCENLTRIDECLTFAKNNDLITDKDLKEAQKIAQILKEGKITPGNCKTKNECLNYCEDPTNSDECLSFAESNDLIEKDEIENARKVLPLIAKGESPGSCKNKKQCQDYCKDPQNFDECLNFAKKAGIINDEDAKIAQKTHGKGPGNCTSKEECDDFCNQSQNHEKCFSFAKEHHLISQDELDKMKEGMTRLKDSLTQANPQVSTCLKNELGENIIQDINDNSFLPGPEIGDKIKDCFNLSISEFDKDINNMSPQVIDCIQSKIGTTSLDELKQKLAKDPNIRDQIQVCFQGFIQDKTNDNIFGSSTDNNFRESQIIINPELMPCIEKILGKEKMSMFLRGDKVNFQEQISQAKNECQKVKNSFQPHINQISFPSNMVLDCIEKLYGSDAKEKFLKGGLKENLDLKLKMQQCINKNDNATKTDLNNVDSNNDIHPCDSNSGNDCNNSTQNDTQHPKFCPQIYQPVCGSNNITYPNACMAEGAKIIHEGSCNTEPTNAPKQFSTTSIPLLNDQNQITTTPTAQPTNIQPLSPPQSLITPKNLSEALLIQFFKFLAR